MDCLTVAIYYEAAQESESGKRGVAQVVLNRARHPAFPSSICGVVYQGSERKTGCQFTFTRSEERRVGKSVSVRVDLGGRRIIKQTKSTIANIIILPIHETTNH